MPFTRRDALKMGVLGSAALALPLERMARTKLEFKNRMPSSMLPKPFTTEFVTPPVAVPVKRTETTDMYFMDMMAADVEIIPGTRTKVFGYNGITPGPTIMAERGRPVMVRHCNELPALHPTMRYETTTSVHLHGSASLPQYDGYASDITPHMQWKDYHYPNFQDARTLWYHDHGLHHTAENAYMGLAALYILHDDIERGLPIPQGAYDVPLVVRDAMFTKSGDLLFNDNDESGVWGDVILVNGKPWPAMKVERRKYRFRILNASLSRSYEWSLSTGEPFHVVATDGGLMPESQTVAKFRHAPAERYEVVIDFSKYKIGQRIVLRNKSPKNNIDFGSNTSQAMAFDVVADASDLSNNEVPQILNPNAPTFDLTPDMSEKERTLEFKRRKSMWTVNGETWEDVLRSGYRRVVAKPKLNAVETWTLENSSGGWFHPVHIHLIDFQILSRNGKPAFPYERGPKDVVYLGENETVDVIARFGPHEGKYMIHCHNLSHEDHDMMVQFEVGDAGDDWNHPVYAAPPAPMPAPEL